MPIGFGISVAGGGPRPRRRSPTLDPVAAGTTRPARPRPRQEARSEARRDVRQRRAAEDHRARQRRAIPCARASEVIRETRRRKDRVHAAIIGDESLLDTSLPAALRRRSRAAAAAQPVARRRVPQAGPSTSSLALTARRAGAGPRRGSPIDGLEEMKRFAIVILKRASGMELHGTTLWDEMERRSTAEVHRRRELRARGRAEREEEAKNARQARHAPRQHQGRQCHTEAQGDRRRLRPARRPSRAARLAKRCRLRGACSSPTATSKRLARQCQRSSPRTYSTRRTDDREAAGRPRGDTEFSPVQLLGGSNLEQPRARQAPRPPESTARSSSTGSTRRTAPQSCRSSSRRSMRRTAASRSSSRRKRTTAPRS